MKKIIAITQSTFILYICIVVGISLMSCSKDDSVDTIFPPTITEMDPEMALEGEEFIIVGRNFSDVAAENVVSFGGTIIPVVEVNPTDFSTHLELTLMVPMGASLGEHEVTVTVGDLTSEAIVFTVSSIIKIVIPISEGGDDAEEWRGEFEGDPDGMMDLFSSDLELCTEDVDNKHMVGLIFRNVEIPAGATITNAYIQFTCDDDDNQEGPLAMDIWGINEANTSAPFLEDLFNITSRPNTTASVTWFAPIWAVKDEKGPDQATSDLTEIVQEIIDLSGWVSGNNMGFKITNEETEEIHREAEAWDEGEGVGSPPELVVFFEEAK